ncbi:MAG: hypothetical protein WCX82_01945 [archaeon]|jgi:hypothetical protein
MPRPKPGCEKVPLGKGHFIQGKDIFKTEIATIELPEWNRHIEISENREKDVTNINFEKLKRIIVAMAKKKGMTPSEFASKTVFEHSHIGNIVPSEGDLATLIALNLTWGFEKAKIYRVDGKTKKIIGHLELKFNFDKNILSKLKHDPADIKKNLPNLKQIGIPVNTMGLYVGICEAVDNYVTAVKLQKPSWPKDYTKKYANMLVLQKLGFEYKFVPAEGYNILDEDMDFHKI